MSALRSQSWRLVFLPLLLTASLLLPALHLHPVHEHDLDGHQHQNAIIHADFFSVAKQDHHRAQHENVAFEEGEDSTVSQIALSALLGRSPDCSLKNFTHSAGFFRADRNLVQTRPFLRSQIQKRNHWPPVQAIFLAPIAPRSPPSLT